MRVCNLDTGNVSSIVKLLQDTSFHRPAKYFQNSGGRPDFSFRWVLVDGDGNHILVAGQPEEHFIVHGGEPHHVHTVEGSVAEAACFFTLMETAFEGDLSLGYRADYGGEFYEMVDIYMSRIGGEWYLVDRNDTMEPVL